MKIVHSSTNLDVGQCRLSAGEHIINKCFRHFVRQIWCSFLLLLPILAVSFASVTHFHQSMFRGDFLQVDIINEDVVATNFGNVT